MKKIAFVLLGLLAALAAFITGVWAIKGDNLFAFALPLGFAYGAYCAFRKVGRLASARTAVRAAPVAPVRRPWEH